MDADITGDRTGRDADLTDIGAGGEYGHCVRLRDV